MKPPTTPRPASFEVLGQTFTVEYVDTLKKGVGWCIDTEQRVLIRNAQGPDQERDTLLHEVLHAALKVAGVRVGSSKSEEAMVRGLAPVLLDVLRSSPELVGFLLA